MVHQCMYSYLHWPVNGLVVLHNISTPLLQFGEVEGEAQSETQAGHGIVEPHTVYHWPALGALNRRRRAQCITRSFLEAARNRHHIWLQICHQYIVKSSLLGRDKS